MKFNKFTVEKKMLCPLDSRYKTKVGEIATIFEPKSLTEKRLHVMDFWLQFICKKLGVECKSSLSSMITQAEHDEIEQLEFNVTRHDINACIKFLEKKYADTPHVIPYIHFGLTSNDVNSVAYANLLDWGRRYISEQIFDVIRNIKNFGCKNEYPMLARTHGQAATPTTFRNAMWVFAERLEREAVKLKKIEIYCKFGGATGGMNTLYLVRPFIDWEEALDNFIENNFELHRSRFTTQIDHYDCYAEIFDCLKRISVILLNFVQDIWLYISLGYIIQKPNPKEVGSSTMPHKVNPIQMENAKGNLLLAKSLFNTLSDELPISTLQRDLHDSTMLRNIGMPFGYLKLAMTSIEEGLKRYYPSRDNMLADLNQHWEVLGEAIQTVLRYEGRMDAYDIVKMLTRNNEKMDQIAYRRLIANLYENGTLSAEGHYKLFKLTPETYLPGFLQYPKI